MICNVCDMVYDLLQGMQSIHLNTHSMYYTGSTVDEFLRLYRKSFPNATVTPKLHMLEDHVVQWMRKWHWALGLHGEQGAESIHNIFNTLERTYSAVRNPLTCMRCMFKEHQIQTSAHTASLEPAVVKRKGNSSSET